MEVSGMEWKEAEKEVNKTKTDGKIRHGKTYDKQCVANRRRKGEELWQIKREIQQGFRQFQM